MAKVSGVPHILTISVLFLSLINFAYVEAEEWEMISTSIIQKPKEEEKLTHLRFFWRDYVGGPNPTSVTVVESPTKIPHAFGYVNMIDIEVIGRAQGFYALASKEEFDLFMAMNLVFLRGKYNGSTITVMDRNPVPETVREMPVVGGSGVFRMARGYAQAKPIPTLEMLLRSVMFMYTLRKIKSVEMMHDR